MFASARARPAFAGTARPLAAGVALRAFTTAVLAFGAGCQPLPPQPTGWSADFALPEATDLDPSDGAVEVALTARVQSLEIVPGTRTPMWTYNGTVPGPTLRARKGQRLTVHFTNELPEATTVHWHGLRVPAAMDGTEAVQNPIPPGGSFDYAFDLLDSGTYWYHPHLNSSAQVGYGLYGAIVVEDPQEPGLGDELLLVLSDAGIDDDGTLWPGDQTGWFGDYFGREGNRLLVNGRLPSWGTAGDAASVFPRVLARAGLPQRWRIVNAARSRYMLFEVPGQSVVRVGGDGGLLERPLDTTEVRLVPGERAELHLRPQAQVDGPVAIQWRDANRVHSPGLRPPELMFGLQVVDVPAVAGAPGVPSTLRAIPELPLSEASTQVVSLDEVSSGGTTVLGINGQPAESAVPIHAQLGAVQLWEVRNSTDYDHPFHLHGYFFQVLAQEGVAPPVREWKDSVNVAANTTTRLAVSFESRPGSWMFHCHILDHAELGMMGMLMVMP